MEPYNLFADLLSTFRSLNDGIKALMVIGFYAAPVGLAWAWAYAKRGRAPQETPEKEPELVDAEPDAPARLAVRGVRIEKL